MRGGFADLGAWLDRRLGGQWREPRVRRLIWAGLFFVLFTALLATAVAPNQVRIQPGQAAPRDLVAPKQLIDRPTTERLRREAAQAVPEEYQQDGSVRGQVQRDVETAFRIVAAVQEDVRQRGADAGNGQSPSAPAEAASEEEGRRRLAEGLGLPISSPMAAALLEADADTLDRMRRDLARVLDRQLEQGIKEDQLESARTRLREEIRQWDYPEPLKDFLGLLGSQVLRPNLLYDREGTEAARRRAMEQVQPVVIVPGEVIVEAGEKVTEDDLVRLRDAGLLRDDPWGLAGIWAGAALFVLLAMGVAGSYLVTFDRRVYQEEHRFVLFGFVLLVAFVFARLLQPVSPYLMPVATGPMLLAVLLNPRTALVAAMLLGAVAGVVTGDLFRFGLLAWIGGAAASFSVARLGHRSDFIRAGVVTAAANGAAVLAWSLMFGTAPIYGLETWSQVAWAAFGGVLSAILTIGLLPFLEGFFGLVTPVRLIELGNPNQPLLRRLLVEAPGTYHHSLMVANLAEAAVEEVGGNSLLARVGAYYHDIGKIKRPYFFIENQFGGENPHDKLSPNLSALIITAHVKDGIELARQHRLPEEIIRFIREHHGTTRVEYFLRRAQEQGESRQVLEGNFRYDGPPPTTRETAVVMLADAVEATVRSLGHLTPSRIQQVVRKVIQDRLADGQLDRADLTLRDLGRIADAFVRVLTGVFHHRIEYPEVVLREIERSRRREGKEPGKDGGRWDAASRAGTERDAPQGPGVRQRRDLRDEATGRGRGPDRSPGSAGEGGGIGPHLGAGGQGAGRGASVSTAG